MPQADSQVSKPLAKGETVLLHFQVLCDLALAKLLEAFSSHCTLAIHSVVSTGLKGNKTNF